MTTNEGASAIAGRDEKGKPLTKEEVEERTKKKLEADEKEHEKVAEEVKKEGDEAAKKAKEQEKADKEFEEAQKKKTEKSEHGANQATGAKPAAGHR